MDRPRGHFGRIALGITAAVSACWAGYWMAEWEKPLPEGLPPLYYDPFVRQLVAHGRYVLPCGGGVISEPDRAIEELQGEYGPAGLRDRCYALLFEQPPDAEYPEGIDRTALGILNRLGDPAMLQKLIQMRHGLLQHSPDTQPAEEWQRRHTHLESCECLIARLCHRLRQPLPDGVPPLMNDL